MFVVPDPTPGCAVFYNSGQDCCAGTRLLVQDSCYDEFMPKLIAAAKACAIGDVRQPPE